jgi:hypothetical protein
MSRDYDPTLEPEVEFYRVTDKDLTGEPGTLIRSEQLAQDDAAALDDARATYHVLYRSTSGLGDEETKPTNEPIAVSGSHCLSFRRPATWPMAGGQLGARECRQRRPQCTVHGLLSQERVAGRRGFGLAP